MFVSAFEKHLGFNITMKLVDFLYPAYRILDLKQPVTARARVNSLINRAIGRLLPLRLGPG